MQLLAWRCAASGHGRHGYAHGSFTNKGFNMVWSIVTRTPLPILHAPPTPLTQILYFLNGPPSVFSNVHPRRQGYFHHLLLWTVGSSWLYKRVRFDHHLDFTSWGYCKAQFQWNEHWSLWNDCAERPSPTRRSLILHGR